MPYIKVSGGLFRDMMIHDFDMANILMGAAPVTVSAVGSAIVGPAMGAEWAAFVTAVNSGSPLPVTLDDDIAALGMAEAATTSLRTGALVKLMSLFDSQTGPASVRGR